MAFAENRFEETMRRFQEQAAAAATLKEKIATIKGSARSQDGSVTVTVAPSGAVLGLQLAPNAMHRSHTQLTQDILGAIRQATQQAAALMEETVRPVLGDDTYGRFQSALRAQAPAVEPLGPTAPPPASALPSAPPPPPAPRRRYSDEGDDFSNDSIYGGGR